ncbi:MAG: NADH-quinone oxidoreductase subunit N [Acidobacteriota bacterium]
MEGQAAGWDLSALWPAVVLAVGGLVALMLEVSRFRRLAGTISAVFTVLAGAVLFLGSPGDPSPLTNVLALELANDYLVWAMAPVFLLSALAVHLLGGRHLERHGRYRAEFHALVSFSAAGMLILVQARDLLVFFLGLETLSIPLYVLCGFVSNRERSVESGLKYFTIGAFSSAFIAFGLALVYGAFGTLSFAEMTPALDAIVGGDAGRLLLARGGLGMLIVGFGFKIAAVPFHAWAGDVYQGAPTPVTILLAVGSKAAGLAGLIRILAGPLGEIPGWVSPAIVVAAVTLIVGNCVATVQEDVKRLIAYSGISHAGFLLVGLVAHQRVGQPIEGGFIVDLANQPALQALLFYVIAYALMTLGALVIVEHVEQAPDERTRLIDLAGLVHRQPLLAGALLILLLSLGGMPPLAGFFGKWMVLKTAVDGGLMPLAIVAVLASVVGFYYYLRIVLQAFLMPVRESAREPGRLGWSAAFLIGFTVAATLLLGFWPGWLLERLEGPLPQAALAALSR